MAIIDYQTPRKPFSMPPWVIRWLPRVLVIFIVLAVLLMYLLTDTIRPETLTWSRVSLTEQRIREYVAQHHRLPEKLSDLPPLSANRDSRTEDAWGQPLIYHPQPDGSVILGSRWAERGKFAFTVHFDPRATSSLEEGRTPGSLMLTKDRIRMYAAQNHKLPAALSDLPPVAGAETPLDGWGRPFVYEPQADGSVILRSLGKGGKVDVTTVHFTVRK